MLPPDPLVICERIYFCTNVRIWIDLGEKYGTKFGLLIYYPKNQQIFMLIITYFGILRMHQVAPFLSFFPGGACTPSTSLN